MVCFSFRNRMGLINQQKGEIPCCVERFELVRRRERQRQYPSQDLNDDKRLIYFTVSISSSVYCSFYVESTWPCRLHSPQYRNMYKYKYLYSSTVWTYCSTSSAYTYISYLTDICIYKPQYNRRDSAAQILLNLCRLNIDVETNQCTISAIKKY